MFYTYILQSRATGRYYVGHCDHLIKRFHQHQSGQNRSTRNRGPWWVPYYEIFETRTEAMAREREIKAKKSVASIRRIIANAPWFHALSQAW